jgi:hypothetical protein
MNRRVTVVVTAAMTSVEAAMRLRPLVRTGLGLATLVAVSTMWVAIGDRHWAATLVLAIMALTCAYPAVTGRDPFDPRHRRRKHRRHRSRRHGTASGPGAPSHGDGQA